MQVLSLCDGAKHLIPYTLEDKIGDGADGEVFSIKGIEDKVIKFSIYYNWSNQNIFNQIQNISSTLNYLMAVHPRLYARVYEFQKLKVASRLLYNGELQQYFIYYYVMEKLEKLSDDEKKVFHSIICHEDRGIVKNYNSKKLHEVLVGLSLGLDFDAERVKFFYENLRRAEIQHLDLHVRNIMKDAAGNFKLIDFDRIKIGRENAET